MKPGAFLTRRTGLGLLAMLLLGLLVFVFLRSGPLAPTRVTLTKVTEGRLAPALFGVGTVEARRSYLIGPTTAGRVLRVVVDVGDTVRAGQLLAEIDPVDFEQRLAAFDASTARAASAIAVAQAQHSDALARRELAAANARRYADLGRQNFVSAGSVEARLQEQASADAAVSGADASLSAARQDLQRIGAERAGVRQQRDNLRLLAPGAGVVVSRDLEPGSTAVAGQAVIRLIEPASLWVRVRFDQGRSAGLVVGLPARITLRSSPSNLLAGAVARVEAVSDSVTEERIAQVAFDSPPPGVSVGELAEVTLTLPDTASALLLPNASIRRQAEQTGVWLVDGNGMRFAPVRLGRVGLDGQIQVLEGLRAGAEVVVYSEEELGPGSRITVVEALAPSGR